MSLHEHDIRRLMLDHGRVVESIVRREAGVVLLRFESVEDLSQGVTQEAIRAGSEFTWKGDNAFAAWINVVAKRYLSGRRDYWFARKRNPGKILRLTFHGGRPGGGRPGSAPPDPGLADTATGPATFAFRREQLVLATRALDMLLPRDRDLVTWVSEGESASGIAERLGVSPDAAEKARSRALERLRKAFVILSRRLQGPAVPGARTEPSSS